MVSYDVFQEIKAGGSTGFGARKRARRIKVIIGILLSRIRSSTFLISLNQYLKTPYF
jgi:hypothetical protein